MTRKSAVFSFIGVFGILFAATMTARANPADRIEVTTQDGNTVVTLKGGPDSVAAEIYSDLQKGGVPERDEGPTRVLSGGLIHASVFYLNGTVYRVSMTIDPSSFYGMLPNRCAPASTCPGATAHLTIGGDVATELFGDLQKAGDPVSHSSYGESVNGQALNCAYFVAEEARYSCSIAIPEAAY